MKSDALLSQFRSEMQDVAAPFLWTDAEVYSHIDDAQKMFCRLTDGISDASTTAVTQIAVSVGDTWLDLHPRILKIRDVTRASDGRPVSLLNFEDLPTKGYRLVPGQSGVVEVAITGMEENKLRLLRAASLADTLQLVVFRLPIVDITTTAQDFEIPDQHHVHLLPWVKSRALLKTDAETYDKEGSEKFAAMFEAYCRQAKKEQEMKRHKGPRTVAYGGISSGCTPQGFNGYGRRYPL